MSKLKSFFGAITFYTTVPLPPSWELDFQEVARWAPMVGLFIGGFLGLLDFALAHLGVPILTRSAAIVVGWIVLTGGLHLDGAMDTADGLAVTEPKRRLEVMRDSRTGAFGTIAAVVLLLLKTAALSELESYRWLGLMLAAGWGRWGQVVAIARYPYLRPTGKGAFHKQAIRVPQDICCGPIWLLGVCALQMYWDWERWWLAVGTALSGSAIAFLTGFWFYRRLGGHTGDTYGAVVEWTETLFLCLLTGLF